MKVIYIPTGSDSHSDSGSLFSGLLVCFFLFLGKIGGRGHLPTYLLRYYCTQPQDLGDLNQSLLHHHEPSEGNLVRMLGVVQGRLGQVNIAFLSCIAWYQRESLFT